MEYDDAQRYAVMPVDQGHSQVLNLATGGEVPRLVAVEGGVLEDGRSV